MTNAVIGALRVNLGIDTAEFQEGLRAAKAGTGKFSAALKATFAGIVTTAGAAFGSLSLIVNQLATDMEGLKKSADMSGIGIEDFQKWAYAAKSVQIESEKLSDIFKDVNDKIGDFAQTGGGAMKDFFENIAPKVGLTADAFKDLSGPDALQAYYNALQKAGVSQSDMTFYMEAIASDATALIPLLRDNGKAFEELGAKAAIISEEKAASLRAYNESMRTLGEAVKAVGIAFISVGFVDMLSAIINKFAELIRSVAGVIDILPTLMEYASVAGGALALMVAPAILSSVGALTVAIGTGLVNAVRLLTIVIRNNPLGALAIGIATAVTAIYHFRDEIKNAIGVDVVQLVRDAANLVIGSFVAAFEDIKFVWNNFPAILKAAGVGAANGFISAIEWMVNKALSGFNRLIEGANSLSEMLGGKWVAEQFGWSGQFDTIAPAEFGRISSDTGLDEAVTARNAAVQAALSHDYIGELGQAFTLSTPAVQDFTSSIGSLNNEMDEMSGGGKGGKGGGGKIKQVKDGIDQMAKAMDSAKESLGKGFGDILNGLINKSMTWKDALVSVGQELLKFLNQMNLAQGGSGLFGGGLVQGLIGSLFGFANGGTIMPGGTGGIDSQLVAFRKSPNERVDITKPGQTLSSGSGGDNIYHIDARGADQAAVDRIYRGLQERDKNFGRMVDGRNDTRQLRKGRG